MIFGASLYGFSASFSALRRSSEILTVDSVANAYEEWRVRQSPLYEVVCGNAFARTAGSDRIIVQVVGQLGMWGTIINGIQAACLEHKGIRAGPWTGATVGFLIAYTAGTISLSFCP